VERLEELINLTKDEIMNNHLTIEGLVNEKSETAQFKRLPDYILHVAE